jgi:hypothetical protein
MFPMVKRSHVAVPILTIPVVLAVLWSSHSEYVRLSGQGAHDQFHIANAWNARGKGGVWTVLLEHPHGSPIAGALLGSFSGPA